MYLPSVLVPGFDLGVGQVGFGRQFHSVLHTEVLTACFGTRFWPGCRSGWVWTPVPFCLAHWGTYRLFWYQVLTWVSVRLSLDASSILSRTLIEILTACFGTMFWPGCRWGWVWTPVPFCLAHWGTYRLFWYQVLTWVSVRLSLDASSILSCTLRYLPSVLVPGFDLGVSQVEFGRQFHSVLHTEILTVCFGTRFWPGCRSGWVWTPVPFCPAHWGTSDARSFSPDSSAGGQWRPSAPCGASCVLSRKVKNHYHRHHLHLYRKVHVT